MERGTLIKWTSPVVHLGVSVVDVYAKVANRVLDLAVTEQDLDSAQISCGLVDERRLCSAERMSPVFLWCKSDGSHPLVDKSCILARAEMVVGMDAAGECEIINASTSAFEPGEQAGSRIGGDLKLNWSSRLLLDHHRSRSNGRSNYKRTDLDFHQVTTSKLAVECEVEERSISHSSFPT